MTEPTKCVPSKDSNQPFVGFVMRRLFKILQMKTQLLKIVVERGIWTESMRNVTLGSLENDLILHDCLIPFIYDTHLCMKTGDTATRRMAFRSSQQKPDHNKNVYHLSKHSR